MDFQSAMETFAEAWVAANAGAAQVSSSRRFYENSIFLFVILFILNFQIGRRKIFREIVCH